MQPSPIHASTQLFLTVGIAHLKAAGHADLANKKTVGGERLLLGCSAGGGGQCMQQLRLQAAKEGPNHIRPRTDPNAPTTARSGTPGGSCRPTCGSPWRGG
jgi:hypothetical protein